MMTFGLRLILLLFALVGFGGAGASVAVARYRSIADGERDVGMLGVAAMLLIFGALCAGVGVGVVGIPAFGGVVAWAAYLFMAQHMGMFRIDAGDGPFTEEEWTEESHRPN